MRRISFEEIRATPSMFPNLETLLDNPLDTTVVLVAPSDDCGQHIRSWYLERGEIPFYVKGAEGWQGLFVTILADNAPGPSQVNTRYNWSLTRFVIVAPRFAEEPLQLSLF